MEKAKEGFSFFILNHFNGKGAVFNYTKSLQTVSAAKIHTIKSSCHQ